MLILGEFRSFGPMNPKGHVFEVISQSRRTHDDITAVIIFQRSERSFSENLSKTWSFDQR